MPWEPLPSKGYRGAIIVTDGDYALDLRRTLALLNKSRLLCSLWNQKLNGQRLWKLWVSSTNTAKSFENGVEIQTVSIRLERTFGEASFVRIITHPLDSIFSKYWTNQLNSLEVKEIKWVNELSFTVDPRPVSLAVQEKGLFVCLFFPNYKNCLRITSRIALMLIASCWSGALTIILLKSSSVAPKTSHTAVYLLCWVPFLSLVVYLVSKLGQASLGCLVVFKWSIEFSLPRVCNFYIKFGKLAGASLRALEP